MVVVSAYLVFAPFYDAPLQSFYCLLFVSAGIPFYLVFVRYKVVPPSFLRFVGKPLNQETLRPICFPDSKIKKIAK